MIRLDEKQYRAVKKMTILPVIYRAIKSHYPQLLLRNPPISDAENQLSQFQTDLIIYSLLRGNGRMPSTLRKSGAAGSCGATVVTARPLS